MTAVPFKLSKNKEDIFIFLFFLFSLTENKIENIQSKDRIQGELYYILQKKDLKGSDVNQTCHSINKRLLKIISTPHACMPVESCVCCLFWTNRNSMAVTYIFLSISLSKSRYKSFNLRYQWMEIFNSTETMAPFQWKKSMFSFSLISQKFVIFFSNL